MNEKQYLRWTCALGGMLIGATLSLGGIATIFTFHLPIVGILMMLLGLLIHFKARDIGNKLIQEIERNDKRS